MKTILKTGYKKIINLFYADKFSKIHLRDIARKTKLNENSVSRFLNQLQKDQILKSEKDGNLKKYSIKMNSLAFSIFMVFDIQRFNKLPSIRKNAIKYFLKKLENQPIIILLFGSTAKFNFTKKSDIDILLIVNQKIKINDAENYAESQTGLKINCFQINYKNFINELKIKEDNVIQSAINSGYPLTNHLKYYLEVLK